MSLAPTGYVLDDTIVAASSAPGGAARAIVRITGPQARVVISELLADGSGPLPIRTRGRCPAALEMADVLPHLPVELITWTAPQSYTGQDLIEVHLPGCPPLVEALQGAAVQAGARMARPGEFTLRAFLAGKLDLAQAEAVLGVIEATDTSELRRALQQRAGGLTQPLHRLREQLLNLLAEVEAGLDFAEEDLTFVSEAVLLREIRAATALVESSLEGLKDRALATAPFRAVLVGSPNIGKSSLFNALAGAARALVSPEAGTTRDYLVHRFDADGVAIELIDTAGLQLEVDDGAMRQGQSFRLEQTTEADLLLHCVEAGATNLAQAQSNGPSLLVWTKCDARPTAAPEDGIATSTVTGAGLDALRAAIVAAAGSARRPSALLGSHSRCRQHLEQALVHLREAESILSLRQPADLLALELRLALEELGALVGATYVNDLLDRVFSQFCIGK